MSILFSNEILDSVKKELTNASESVQIITAYCKESSLQHLNKCISSSVSEKKLLVRFRMDDVIKGSTDFSILEYALSEGWKIFIRFDLHAKTYIVDKKRGLVGSANVTNSGLSIGMSGNMEIATLIDIEPQDIAKIERLYDDAIEVDDAILDKLKRQIEGISTGEKKSAYMWDSSITNLFIPKVETLFTYELPDDSSLSDGKYVAFLDETYTGNKDKLKDSFRWSNIYLWMLQILKESGGEIYFGELSAKLHNVLVSDPKPYRKDVKIMLTNLLSLIEELEMEDFVIDRPNYSQRIRMRNV